MKVSVIIPTYNCGKFLADCIGSVKAQTYKDWECIVVDDASTDDTAEILPELIGDDPRFTFKRYARNAGLSATRNRGLRLATGEAVFFLDADDWISATALEYLVGVAEQYPEAGRIVAPCISHWTIATGRWEIKPTGLHKADSPWLFKDFTCDVGHSTGSLYVLDRIAGDFTFPPEVRKYEDMVFNAGLIFSGITTVITDEYLYHYRRRLGSLVNQPFLKEEAEAARKAFEELAQKYQPAEEVYARCSNFLQGILDTVGGEGSKLRSIMFKD